MASTAFILQMSGHGGDVWEAIGSREWPFSARPFNQVPHIRQLYPHRKTPASSCRRCRELLALGKGPKLPLPRQSWLFSVYWGDRDWAIKRDTEVSGWDGSVEEFVCTQEHVNVLWACGTSVVESNFSAQESSWQQGDNRIVGMVTDQWTDKRTAETLNEGKSCPQNEGGRNKTHKKEKAKKHINKLVKVPKPLMLWQSVWWAKNAWLVGQH